MAWYTGTMPPHKREQVLSAIRDKVVSDQVLYIGKQAKIKLPKSKIYICIGKFMVHVRLFPAPFHFFSPLQQNLYLHPCTKRIKVDQSTKRTNKNHDSCQHCLQSNCCHWSLSGCIESSKEAWDMSLFG